MSGAEYHELASWVKRRLDEVFPDDSEPSGAQRERVTDAVEPKGQRPDRVEPVTAETSAGGLPKVPSRRIELVKPAKPAARVPAPPDPVSPDGGVRPDAPSAKALQMAEIRKLFRKLEPPVDFWEDGRAPDAPRQGPAGPDDFREIGVRVRERLDAVFPDDSVPTEVSREERKGLFDIAHPAMPPREETQGWTKGSDTPRDMPKSLTRLQAIAGEFQVGPLRVLEAYARELERIRPEFEDEHHVLVLIELQAGLCRYMTTRFRGIHRQAATTLLAGFSAMERLTTDLGLSTADQRQILGRVLREFKNFNRSLAAGGTQPQPERRPPQPDSAAPSGPDRRPAPRLAVEQVEELREFLRDEFQRLEGRLLTRLRLR